MEACTEAMWYLNFPGLLLGLFLSSSVHSHISASTLPRPQSLPRSVQQSSPKPAQLKEHVLAAAGGFGCNCCEAFSEGRGCPDFTQLSNKGQPCGCSNACRSAPGAENTRRHKSTLTNSILKKLSYLCAVLLRERPALFSTIKIQRFPSEV